jgi:hypothetical protein
MSDTTQPRRALVARILEVDARALHARRRAAFDNAGLVEPLKSSGMQFYSGVIRTGLFSRIRPERLAA